MTTSAAEAGPDRGGDAPDAQAQDHGAPVLYPAYCHALAPAPTHAKWVKLTAADVHALRVEAGYAGAHGLLCFHLNHPIEYVYLAGVVVAIEHISTRYNTRFSTLQLDDGSGEVIEVKISYSKPPAQGDAVADVGRAGANQGNVSEESADEGDGDEAIDDTNLPDSVRPRVLQTTHYTTAVDGMVALIGPFGDSMTLHGEEIDIGSMLKVKGTLARFRDSMQVVLERAAFVRRLEEEAAFWDDYAAFATRVLARPWHVSAEQLRKVEQALEADAQRARHDKNKDRAREARRVRRAAAAARKAADEEVRLAAQAAELDGNALDLPGWRAYELPPPDDSPSGSETGSPPPAQQAPAPLPQAQAQPPVGRDRSLSVSSAASQIDSSADKRGPQADAEPEPEPETASRPWLDVDRLLLARTWRPVHGRPPIGALGRAPLDGPWAHEVGRVGAAGGVAGGAVEDEEPAEDEPGKQRAGPADNAESALAAKRLRDAGEPRAHGQAGPGQRGQAGAAQADGAAAAAGTGHDAATIAASKREGRRRRKERKKLRYSVR